MEKIGLRFEDIYLLKVLAQEKMRIIQEEIDLIKYKQEKTEDEEKVNYLQKCKQEWTTEMEKYKRIVFLFDTANLI